VVKPQICGCGCGFQVDIQYRKLAVVVLTMIPKTTVLPQPIWFYVSETRNARNGIPREVETRKEFRDKVTWENAGKNQYSILHR
jgi:hypothetical protein